MTQAANIRSETGAADTANPGGSTSRLATAKAALANDISAGGAERRSGLDMLLAIEDRIRAAQDETELVHLIANESRKLVAARQIFVLRAKRPGEFQVTCVSSIGVLDRDTPFLRWIEAMVARITGEKGDAAPVSFSLPAFVDENATETKSYPFSFLHWQPLKLRGGESFAGLLFARERPWSEADQRMIARQALVFSNAWQALYGGKSLRPRRLVTNPIRAVLTVTALLALLIPVPMTTLAPVEIVARAPTRVTAPIDGVIATIHAAPNKPIHIGEPLLSFEDTALRNRLTIAEQELLVARARFERAQQAAFSEESARHDLAITRSEQALKQAERDYAKALLDQTVVRAGRDGLLIYADKDRWLGKPVRTGERIMAIADPNDVIARIDVPVADAIALSGDARIRLFLDSDPLTAVEARLLDAGYHAEPDSVQQLAYKLHATPQANAGAALRIGARGTAQLSGDKVPLGYFLFRRPISALRQHFGI